MVLVELKRVWEASGSCKGTHGDPKGSLFLEDPFIVRCEVGGAIRRREWTKLVTSVSGGDGSIVLDTREDVWVNGCER